MTASQIVVAGAAILIVPSVVISAVRVATRGPREAWEDFRWEWSNFYWNLRDACKLRWLKGALQGVLAFTILTAVVALAAPPLRELFRRLGEHRTIEPIEETTGQIRLTRHHWFARDEVLILEARRDEDGTWQWMEKSGTNWFPAFAWQ